MKITRQKVLRILPAIAINVVPLVGVVEFGWSVAGPFLIFVLETWILIALDALRIAIAPARGCWNGSTLPAPSLARTSKVSDPSPRLE